MKMCSSGFAPRRRQGGFIQGAILFALVIIAVVVAAFSLANRDSQSSADSEQARVNASFVLTVGNNLQTAVSRAIADGFQPADLVANMKFLQSEATADGELNLFDESLKYMIRPPFPLTALETTANQPFTATTTEATWEDEAVAGVGVETELEAIIVIGNIKEDVCRRINVTANRVVVTDPIIATLSAAAAAGLREGCFGTAPTFSYFRVVATDVS
jgi:hypothetical protein